MDDDDVTQLVDESVAAVAKRFADEGIPLTADEEQVLHTCILRLAYAKT